MPRITILANRIPKKVKPSGYPIRVFKCVLGLHTTIIWSYHVHITIGLPLDIEGLLTGCIIYHGLFTGCIMYCLLIHRLLFYSVVGEMAAILVVLHAKKLLNLDPIGEGLYKNLSTLNINLLLPNIETPLSIPWIILLHSLYRDSCCCNGIVGWNCTLHTLFYFCQHLSHSQDSYRGQV